MAAADTRRRLKADDLYAFGWVSDPQISPCGSRIAYVVTRIEDKKYRSSIWVAPFSGGEPRQLTNGPKIDRSPRWSPCGKKLAFVSDRAGSGQIWVIDTDGGEARQVTAQSSGVSEVSWSPDGTRLAFIHRCALLDDDADGEKREKSDVRVYDRIKFKADGRGLWDGKYAHVYVADTATGKAKRLTEGEFDHADICWSPDGSHLAFVSNRTSEADYTNVTDVWVVPSAGGEPHQVTTSLGPCSSPRFSPDGSLIAYMSHDNAYMSATLPSIWVVPAKGGEPKRLSPPLSAGNASGSDMRYGDNAQGLMFSTCGKYISFLATENGVSNIYQLSIATGRIEPVTRGEHSIFGVTRRETRYALALGDHLNPGDVYGFDSASGEWSRLTRINEAFLSQVHLSEPQRIRFKGDQDWDIEGWLAPPVGSMEGAKYPMVLEIHGGPHAAYGVAFFLEFQLLAAAGYAVLFTNPRGSDSYGQQFLAATKHDWGGGDYRDIMAGVDYAIGLGSIDADRLGVTGGSYGGYMTNWIVGHTHRFKAAVSCRSTCNRYSQFGNSDIGYKNGDFEFPGAPWESPEFYMKHSPITYVANVRTPILLIQSENDYRCPISQAEEFFVALKYLRRKAQLVRFPNEGHELSRSGQPVHRVERLERLVNWFKEHIPLNPEDYAL